MRTPLTSSMASAYCFESTRGQGGRTMLTIGAVALRAGLRPSAVRYYEEVGLVPPPRRRGGQRIYDACVLDRLALIELAKGAGFSLRETRDLIAAVAEHRSAAASWQAMARAKLAEL